MQSHLIRASIAAASYAITVEDTLKTFVDETMKEKVYEQK